MDLKIRNQMIVVLKDNRFTLKNIGDVFKISKTRVANIIEKLKFV